MTSNGAIPWIAVENGAASYVQGARVTGASFEVLGIQPLLGAALLLVTASLAAAYVPTHRATRIEPAAMLRNQ